MNKKLEKSLKEFVNKFQTDLTGLQKQVLKEGDELINKVKKVAKKEQFEQKISELEVLLNKKLLEFEPKINTMIKKISTNAKKAGIDLDSIEDKVLDNISKASKSLKNRSKTKTKKKTAVKRKTTAKKKSSAKKNTVTKTKSTTKKKTTTKKKVSTKK